MDTDTLQICDGCAYLEKPHKSRRGADGKPVWWCYDTARCRHRNGSQAPETVKQTIRHLHEQFFSQVDPVVGLTVTGLEFEDEMSRAANPLGPKRKGIGRKKVGRSYRHHKGYLDAVLPNVPPAWSSAFPERQRPLVRAYLRQCEQTGNPPTHAGLADIVGKTPQDVHKILSGNRLRVRAAELSKKRRELDYEHPEHTEKRRGEKHPIRWRRHYTAGRGEPVVLCEGETDTSTRKADTRATVHMPSAVNEWWHAEIMRIVDAEGVDYAKAYELAHERYIIRRFCETCRTPLPLGVRIGGRRISTATRFCGDTCKKVSLRRVCPPKAS